MRFPKRPLKDLVHRAWLGWSSVRMSGFVRPVPRSLATIGRAHFAYQYPVRIRRWWSNLDGQILHRWEHPRLGCMVFARWDVRFVAMILGDSFTVHRKMCLGLPISPLLSSAGDGLAEYSALTWPDLPVPKGVTFRPPTILGNYCAVCVLICICSLSSSANWRSLT